MDKKTTQRERFGRNMAGKGFTLVEVLVAMFIGLVIAAMLFLTLERQSIRHTAETEKSQIQEKIVGAMDIMGKEIRMAGYLAPEEPVMVATPYTFKFKADIDRSTSDADIENSSLSELELEYITYKFVPPTSPGGDAWKDTTHDGMLQRIYEDYEDHDSDPNTPPVLASPDTRTFDDNLDNVTFEYYDENGELIDPDDLKPSNPKSEKYRDKIKRIRVNIEDSTQSAAASPGEMPTRQSDIKSTRRKVVRDIAPPNLGIEQYKPCGKIIIQVKATVMNYLNACDGDLAEVDVTTRRWDDSTKTFVDSNVGDVDIEVSSASLYTDTSKTTALNNPFTAVDGARNSTVSFAVESKTKVKGQELLIEVDWGPQLDWCEDKLEAEKSIVIIPGEPCQITASPVHSDVYPCYPVAGASACADDNIADTDFTLKDACGNTYQEAGAYTPSMLPDWPYHMNFQLVEDPGGGNEGTITYLDPLDNPGDSTTGHEDPLGPQEVADDSTVTIRYTAPSDVSGLTADKFFEQELNAWIPSGEFSGCSGGNDQDSPASSFYHLRACNPTWDTEWIHRPDAPHGCKNAIYPIMVTLKDGCDIPYTGLTDLKASFDETKMTVEGDEHIENTLASSPQSAPPDDSVIMHEKHWSTHQETPGEYYVTYKTRTDQAFGHYEDGNFVPDTHYVKVDFSSATLGSLGVQDSDFIDNTLLECSCYINMVYLPEGYCTASGNPGGLTYACLDPAAFVAGTIVEPNAPDTEGKIEVVNSNAGRVDLMTGDPETDYFPFDSTNNYEWPFWVNNETFALDSEVQLRLVQRDPLMGDEPICEDTFNLRVDCSEGDVEFMEIIDGEWLKAITYDPNSSGEKIYVQVEDCNLTVDKLTLTVTATSGDHENITLYPDSNDIPNDIPTTLYRNDPNNKHYDAGDPGVPLDIDEELDPTKREPDNGALEVTPSDIIRVTYTDPTPGCPDDCPTDQDTDEVRLVVACVSSALYAGGAAAFSGNAFQVHWGDGVVYGDVNYTGQLDKKVPQKDRCMSVSSTAQPYLGAFKADRWFDLYIGGSMAAGDQAKTQPVFTSGSTGCPGDPGTYENIYHGVPKETLDCVMGALDYDDLKTYALENDVYYYSKGGNTIVQYFEDGTEGPEQNFSTLLHNDKRGFIFVDLINAPYLDPQPTGEAIDDGEFDDKFPIIEHDGNTYYEGFLYIAGHLGLTGLGGGKNIEVETPPIQDVEQAMFPPYGESDFDDDLPVYPDENNYDPQTETINVHFNGVVYIEGKMKVGGNARVFGSMATERGFVSAGTPEIWYNHRNGASCGYKNEAPECCEIEVSPEEPVVKPRSQVQFTAEAPTDVNWNIVKNNSGATITSDGLYTAGKQIGTTDLIEVTVPDGSCQKAEAVVTVRCGDITVTGPDTLKVGQKGRYRAGGGIAPYKWSVEYSPATSVIATADDEVTLIPAKEGTVVLTATDKLGCQGAKVINVGGGVGTCETLFFDDFDGGQTGQYDSKWYTCTQLADSEQCSGQDDWQFDVPNGKCNDPELAYSGANVLGNDLGGVGWDGCYENNVENWVVSPRVFAKDKGNTWTDLEIHFYRHAELAGTGLGGSDEMTVLAKCGGTLHEVASYSTLSDTAWTEVSLYAPPECDEEQYTRYFFHLKSDSVGTGGGWTIDNFRICGYPK